jgi:hypothetical protein
MLQPPFVTKQIRVVKHETEATSGLRIGSQN